MSNTDQFEFPTTANSPQLEQPEDEELDEILRQYAEMDEYNGSDLMWTGKYHITDGLEFENTLLAWADRRADRRVEEAYQRGKAEQIERYNMSKQNEAPGRHLKSLTQEIRDNSTHGLTVNGVETYTVSEKTLKQIDATHHPKGGSDA